MCVIEFSKQFHVWAPRPDVLVAPPYKRSARSLCGINLAYLHRLIQWRFKVSLAFPVLTRPFQAHFGMGKPSGTSSAESELRAIVVQTCREVYGRLRQAFGHLTV
jgi:hypothetical protein